MRLFCAELLCSSACAKTETDRKSVVDLIHCRSVKLSHTFFEPFFIYCTDLLQKNNAVL